MSCLLQVSIHIFYMYDTSDHIQNKLIHLQWKIGTYQSHIKYIQGRIRLIHHLIDLVIVLFKFSFSKVSRPETPTSLGWRIQAGARFTLTFSIIFSKHFALPDTGLLRHFQSSSQNNLFCFIKFSLSKESRPKSPT